MRSSACTCTATTSSIRHERPRRDVSSAEAGALRDIWIAGLAPISTLRKRGILTGHTLADLEAEVMDLFEIASIDDEPAVTLAARRSNGDEPVSPVQKAWVACVRRIARARTDLQPYSKKKLMHLARELPALLKSPDQFRNLPTLFAAVGVILVYVEALPGAKIDGCSFVLNKTPVVGISGRGKRLDKVLFTMLHEIAHVVLGHVTNQTIVESLDDHDDTDTDEVEANRQASHWLLPTPLPRAPGRVGAGWVEQVAAERGLAPIVIVGQLQNEGVLEWRTALAKNAPSVTPELGTW
jgi:HTH-type transcriptional regulator/antitoxin HigA